jgi:hypothetical protein
MAQIVLGLGTAHSPQMSVPWDRWQVLVEKDETDTRLDYAALLKRAKPDIADELTPDKWQARYEGCQRAIRTLGDCLRGVNPDVLVVLGDDQHEQFLDDNMPAIAIYHGETLPVVRRRKGPLPDWKKVEEDAWAPTAETYPSHPGLAEHLIRALTADEFDVARSNRLREQVGVGHAFSFVYRRLLPGGSIPLVPVMINTYYPPNQPTPRRCYSLGQALRRAIESWDGDARVAVVASGGLSHVILDEELDRVTIDALQRKDRDALCTLPREKLRGGTSEILNWVAIAGAMEPAQMTLVDYEPCYRSKASTGCGAGFAYWR